MGKGLIVSGGSDGLYTLKLVHNRERIEDEIAALEYAIAKHNEQLAELETERAQYVTERDDITAQIDAAIAATPEGELPDVDALLSKLAQASAQVQGVDVRIAIITGHRLQDSKRKEQLEAVPEDPQQTAWCADLTEDLSGDVGTIEVPAEGVVGEFATWRRAIIRPGHDGRATYNAARDGQMFHREGQAGYQAYLNAAILPGVQRWRPQYRIGTITAIDRDANTCTLTIQAEDSSAQSLIIDPPDLQYTKTGVPIEYMQCDAAVFEVNDRVVVEFTGRDWDAPKVIGFESNPKPCTFLAAYPITYDVGSGSSATLDGDCYPPLSPGDYLRGWLTTGRVFLSRTPRVFTDKTGMDSLINALHWESVAVDRSTVRTVGLGVTIATEAEILAAIPLLDTFSRRRNSGVCEDSSVLRTNQIKRMYQADGEGVIAPDVYPTWPIDFAATLSGNTVNLVYRYRRSVNAGYYQVGINGIFYCSEEMNAPTSIDLGEAATLASFPDIDGFEALRVVKTIPGFARTIPSTSGRATIADQLHIVVEYVPK